MTRNSRAPFALLGALALLGLSAATAQAQVSFTGTALTQNFDTLITTGTAQAWSNNTTLPGWSLFNKTPTAITTYNAGDGSSNAGSFYSFGTGTGTERALGGAASGGAYFGSPASGTVAGWIAFAATNNTGSTATDFTIGYDGEQWRNGGNATAQTMVLEYGFGATFTGVTTWTPAGSAFNFTSPVATATAAAVNGNVAGRVAGRGGTVNQTWAPGQTLWIRWIENNDAGNDHGLAIDNFSLTASLPTAAPEPGTLVLGVLGIAGLVARRRK